MNLSILDSSKLSEAIHDSIDKDRQTLCFLYIVYQTVVANPSVTQSKLEWTLNKMFELENNPCVANAVLSLRTNKTINSWNANTACHLFPNKQADKSWIIEVENNYPYVKAFGAPLIPTSARKNKQG